MSLSCSTWVALSLDRAGGDAGDDVALHEEVKDHRRQRKKQPGRHLLLDWGTELRLHVCQADGRREDVVRLDEELREEVLVPGVEKRDDAHRDEPGQR